MIHQKESPSTRTTTALQDLGQGMKYRGAVERIDDKLISGWCLSTSGLQESVSLEILLGERTITTLQTVRQRQDISEIVGTAVCAGFEFYWLELTESVRDTLVADLQQSNPSEPPEINVRVTGTSFLLDGTLAEGTILTCEQLVRALKALAKGPRLSSIASREALLKSLPAPTPNPAKPRVRALAFYLPQFHAIPENDQWWGKGFTEWTNVTAAKPWFDGHDQPRLPAELGYYDLRTPGVMEAQIELAKTYGLAGFCFHHYWFGGQRLLQYPLERFLAIQHELGFCICWANEPWSRRWDGSEREVLMPQPHSFESDSQFIQDTLPLLKDHRYIRVEGKPILIVYRVALLKEPRAVFDRWRQASIAAGLPGLHICMAETFGSRDPSEFGCDSSVQFPPHNVTARQLNDDSCSLPGMDPKFKGEVYDYGEMVANDIAAPAPEYRRYRTVMLGWDNSSRRGATASIFARFTIGAFEAWLENACQAAERDLPESARLVFINAWNEWGEGTYLEPDRRFGRRYLDAVRRVVLGVESNEATFQVLRQRLADDRSAIMALDRIQDRMLAIEASLQYSIENGRQNSAYLTRTVLSSREPIGCNPKVHGGRGNIDMIGVSQGTIRHVVRRGDIVHIKGWASPLDRSLAAHSTAFLRLCQDPEQSVHYGAILSRSKREDVVQDLTSALPPSPTESHGTSLVNRIRRHFSGGQRSEAHADVSGRVSQLLTSSNLLWSGFSTAFSTQSLEPGRYRISVVFPTVSAQNNPAVEVRFGTTLEVTE